jgi:hypothetical protein
LHGLRIWLLAAVDALRQMLPQWLTAGAERDPPMKRHKAAPPSPVQDP